MSRFFSFLAKKTNEFLGFLRGVLSESDGSPSASRCLMLVFSIFTMWLLWRIFWHLFKINDPGQLGLWLSNLPLLIGSLIGLIMLPYTVNKGSASFTDLASMLAQMRNKAEKVDLSGQVDKVETLKDKLTGGSEPDTGGSGPKG